VTSIDQGSPRFQGKIAVVTAAASGIGRATALRLAREGAVVAALDINPEVVKTTSTVKAAGGQSTSLTLDCMDRTAVEEAFRKLSQELGDIDILVNAVGQPSRNNVYEEFWRSDPDTWDFVIDICLKTAMTCSRQVVARMRERRYGKIVNIASVSAFSPPPTFTEYAAAKAGILGFTRALAVELAPFAVNVNAVSPGPIRSIQSDAQPEQLRARVLATIPMGHYGEPEDVAAGIAYLCSDDAQFVTGNNLVIAGGRVML